MMIKKSVFSLGARSACIVLPLAFFAAGCGSATHGNSSQLETIVGSYGSQAINFSRPTHIFVAGYDGGMGNQFFASSVAKAKRLQELFPLDQIVFVRSNEGVVGKFTKDVTSLGVKIVEDSSKTLTGETLIAYLSKFTTIQSLEFYSHNGAQAGVGLEPGFGDPRLGPTTPGIATLKSHFAADAYATIHGCNGALLIAPAFAKIWGIPVSGAGSSTDFEQLHSNGNWYHNNPGQSPEGGWAKVNKGSYSSSVSCASGICIRMKPDNAPYSKNWVPEKAAGLSFYKFFCPEGSSTCQKTMAKSLLSFPSVLAISASSSLEDFKTVALDYLCPNNVTDQVKKQCKAALLKGLETGNEIYSPLKGNTLECNFSKCNFNASCTWDPSGFPVPQSCTLSAPKNDSPKTLIREFKAYLEGFKQLN